MTAQPSAAAINCFEKMPGKQSLLNNIMKRKPFRGFAMPWRRLVVSLFVYSFDIEYGAPFRSISVWVKLGLRITLELGAPNSIGFILGSAYGASHHEMSPVSH